MTRSGFLTISMWVLGGFLADLAFAYPLSCNKNQTICEIKTKRVTINDYIGVFDGDGYLIAIGRVTKIRGVSRMVKIKKRYGDIRSSHDGLLIKDREADNPKKYFKFLQPVTEQTFGVQLGLTQLGVGESISAFDLQGYGEWAFRDIFYWVGRLGFLTGSGEASKTDDELISQEVTVQAFSLLGGMAFWLGKALDLGLRTELSLGLSNVSVDLEQGGDAKDVVDGRVFPGMGFSYRFETSVMIRRDRFNHYFAGASFFRLQNSNNLGVHLGVTF